MGQVTQAPGRQLSPYKRTSSFDSGRTVSGAILSWSLWLLWQCVRWPLLLFLVIVEPVVTFVLSFLALLGILMTLFCWWVGAPHFPLTLMFGTALSLGATVIAYHALLRLLNR
jgi:hypothetical protein